MNDLARLGLAIDSSQVKRSSEELRKFAAAGKQADGSAKRVESSAAKMGAAMGKAVAGIAATVATVATIRNVVNTLAEFEGGMAKVAAISGATGSELESLRNKAREMGATTEFSAGQAADALGFLSMAGFKAAESVAAIPDVLDLATASGLGLAEAADIASNVMSGFGIEAKNTSRATDVLAKAASISNTNVSQLGQAMTYAAPVSKALGVSIEETAAAIGVLSDAGVQGGRAGNTLRTMLSKLASDTDKSTEALDSLGLTFADINPQANSLEDIFRVLSDTNIDLATATKLVGIEAASNLMILTGGVSTVAGYTEELNKAEGATSEMAQTMRDQLGGDLKTLGSVVADLILSLGDAGLTKVIRTVIQTVTKMVSVTASAIKTLSDNAETLAVALGLLAATRIPALIGAMTSLVAWLGTAEVALWGSMIAAQGLSTAMNLIPGVAIFTGLTVGLGFLLKSFRNARQGAKDFADELERLEGHQKDLGDVMDRYYSNMTRHNLKALKEQRELGVEIAKNLLAAAEAQLKWDLIVGGLAGGVPLLGEKWANQGSEALALIDDLRARLLQAEADLDAVGHAGSNLDIVLGASAETTNRLASAMRESGGAAYEAIPAFKELYETYGSAAAEAEQLLEKLNAIAVADFRASFNHLIESVDDFQKGLGKSGKNAEIFAIMLKQVAAEGDLKTQAKMAGELADMIADSAGGADRLAGEARKVWDGLMEASLQGFELSRSISTSEGEADTLWRTIANVTGALEGAKAAADRLAGALSGVAAQLGAIGRAMSEISPVANVIKNSASALGQLATGALDSAAKGLKSVGETFTFLWGEANKAEASTESMAKALDKRLNPELKKTGGGRSGGKGGKAGAAAESIENMRKQIDQMNLDADPLKKYNAELDKLNKLMETGKLSDGAYNKAVQELSDSLADQIPMVNDVADAWGEFVSSGFTDFKGFVNNILSSFKNMLAQMIAMAARNRIVLSITGGGSIAGTAASAAGGLGGMGGGGGILGSLGGLGGGGGIIGGITSFIGGVGSGFLNAGSALMSGGLGSMATSIGAQVGTAFAGGSIASIGAALGAVALPIAGIAAAISFFKKKTKELDSGLIVSANNMEAFTQTFRKTQTKRFWGLSKKTRTSTGPIQQDDELNAIIGGVRDSVKQYAEALGVGADVFDGFTASVKLSLKGLSEDQVQQKVAEALGQIGDQFAAMVPGLTDYALGNETARETLERLGSSLMLVNQTFEALNYQLFDVSLAGGAMAASLVELLGGLEGFNTATSFFVQNFYTDAEQLQAAANALHLQFEKLNIATPKNAQQFRALVEAQDLTTESGRETYAQLLKMGPAFIQVADAAAAATNRAAAAAAAAQGSAGAASAAASAAGAAAGSASAAANAAANALNATIPDKGTIEQAQKDFEAAQAANAKAAADAQKAAAAAAKAAQRRAAAASAAAKAQAAAQAAANAAMQEAKRIADERYGLETRYYQAIGDTVTLREREIAALDKSNQAFGRMVMMLEDAKKAADALKDSDFASQAAFNVARARAQNMIGVGGGNVVPFTPPNIGSGASGTAPAPSGSGGGGSGGLSPNDQRELLRLLSLIERNTKDTSRGVEDLVDMSDGEGGEVISA